MMIGRTIRIQVWGLEDSTRATRQALVAHVLALAFCLLLVTSTSRAIAQFGGGGVAEEEELPVDEGFNVAESNFDQWIFGQPTPDHGRAHIESQLTVHIEAIDFICGLTDDEVAKLKLAGQGDIKRFYDEVDLLHARFMRVRRNRNAFNEFYQELQPTRARLAAGLFNEGSFFDKVLNRTLNEEKASLYEQAEWERRQFRFHAKLELAVSMMERVVPLRAEQRERFLEVLKAETQPPTGFGQYDYYYVLYQLDRVPDEKLKPIFDEAQWKVIGDFAAQGQAMEVWLKQQRILP